MFGLCWPLVTVASDAVAIMAVAKLHPDDLTSGYVFLKDNMGFCRR